MFELRFCFFVFFQIYKMNIIYDWMWLYKHNYGAGCWTASLITQVYVCRQEHTENLKHGENAIFEML